MICPRCNSVVEDGSSFCTYCGMSLKDVQLKAAPVQETAQKENPAVYENVPPVREEPTCVLPPFTPGAAPEMNYAPEAARFAQPVTPEIKPAKKGSNFKVLSIILGALLIAAIGFGVFMFISKNAVAAELNETQASLSVAESDLEAIQEEYAASYASIEEALTDIEDFARYSNCGFASTDFYADRGIVVLDSSTTSATVTLTITLDDVTVYLSESGYGIDASFDGDWVGDDVNILIERDGSLAEGEVSIATVTFTNDSNSETFDILVICIG